MWLPVDTTGEVKGKQEATATHKQTERVDGLICPWNSDHQLITHTDTREVGENAYCWLYSCE